MPRKTKTKARPQKDLSLKVAGKAFAIQGATVKKGFRGHVLRLTSQPSGCKSSGNSDLVTELRLEGNPPKVTHAYLAGAMFASQYNSSPGEKPVEVTTAGPLDGEGEVALSLNGTVDNIVGYDLKLAGKVTAQRCPGK